MREIEYLVWEKFPYIWVGNEVGIRKPLERITYRIEGNIMEGLYDSQADNEENS